MSTAPSRTQRPSQQRMRRMLAQEDLSPTEFYQGLLRQVVSSLGAVGGAVWQTADDGQLQLASEVNLQATGLLDDAEYHARHERLLQRVLATGRSAIINQREQAGPSDSAAPKELLLVFGPLKHDSTTSGLLEIFQCPTGEPDKQKALLRAVLQACRTASEFQHADRPVDDPERSEGHVESGNETLHSAPSDALLHTERSAVDPQRSAAPAEIAAKVEALRRESTDPHPQRNAQAQPDARDALWGQLEQFTRSVHTGLNPREAAYTIANEGRRLIGCDRVSVAVLRGAKARIEAISGQDYFDPRANQVRSLAKLSSVVAATREPLWFEGDTRSLPPQVEKAVLRYVEESQTKLLAVLPLTRKPPGDETRRREKPIGAIVVERIEDTTPLDGFTQRVETVRQHAGMSLGNALEYRSLFLLPLWRFLGQLGLVVRFRTLPKTILVVGLIAALVAALVMTPADFDLEGRGDLQPVVRQEVFAHVDGQVIAVGVKHLSEVPKDEVLAVMRSTELDAKITELQGQVQARQSELQAIETVRVSERRTMTPAEEKQLTGRKRELEATIASLQDQLKQHRTRKADLYVRAPLAGAVTTLDVRDRLIGRPVARGDALLSVADLKGPWQLEVRMPEDRMGHILRAQRELQQRRREHPGEDLPEDLPVKFILATDPGVTFTGVVREIHQRAEVRGEDGNTVLVKVAIDKDELPQLRPGASVVARLHCGRRSVGYVWFHDLIEFVQSRIMFRL